MQSAKLRVACVQTIARDVGQAHLALTEALEAVDRAAQAGAHLVVLPECTYPAYMLRDWAAPEARPAAREAARRAERAFSAKAREHACHVAVGLVEVAEDALYNSAYLFGPSGDLLGKARKHFLWHFDSRWFSQGVGFDVCDTPWGKTGLLICADGRLPEVMRVLCLKGARLIVDVTNWTASGKDPARLTNPQVDYMMRTRALENRAWIVAADKVGIEQQSVVYCGSSCAISPDGTMVARASSDRPEILTVDIEVASLSAPGQGHDLEPLDDRLDPLASRKPVEYRMLTGPVRDVPAVARLRQAVVPHHMARQVAVVQTSWGPGDARRLADFVHRIVPLLHEQEVGVAVFPEPAVTDPAVPESAGSLDPEDFDMVLAAAIAQSKKAPGMCLFLTGPEANDGGHPYKTCFCISSGIIVGRYRKVHLESPERGVYEPGDLGLQVFETPAGPVGVMIGYEGLIPEVARVLAMGGADLIVWPACFRENRYDHVARTRAAENRLFVAMANESGWGAGESLIADPAGSVICQAFHRTEQAASALCNMSMARFKLVVPNTDVFAGRLPESYSVLT